MTESDLHRILKESVRKVLREVADNSQNIMYLKQAFINALQKDRPSLSCINPENPKGYLYLEDVDFAFELDNIPIEVCATKYAGYEEPSFTSPGGEIRAEGEVYPVCEMGHYNEPLSVTSDDGNFEIPMDDDIRKAVDEFCTVDEDFADEALQFAEPNYWEPDYEYEP